MARIHPASLFLLLAVHVGCGLIENADCEDTCSGEARPIRGARTDFTLAGRDDEFSVISPAVACEDTNDAFVVVIETRGSDDEITVGMWVFDRLVPALQAQDINVAYGLVSCAQPERDGSSRDVGVAVNDWADVDRIAEVVLELAEQDDVAVRTVISVEPELVQCPQIGCGV